MINTMLSIGLSLFLFKKPAEKPYIERTARVTYYWGDNKTSTGKKPKSGHTLAVDPKIIPYHTKVIIPHMGTYRAEDTGPAVVKKIAARKLGRHDAIVVDVYCKNKQEANILIKKHPHFMKIRIYTKKVDKE